MKMLNILSKNEGYDLRGKQGMRYSSDHFLLLILMANLAGANTLRKIQLYIKNNKRKIADELDFHMAGYPCHVTIGTFLDQLDFEKMTSIFNQTFDCSEHFNTSHIALDGKTSRGIGINFLNVFCLKTKNVLGFTEFKKGQEIEAVYNVFALNKIKPDTWVTLDALHSQKKLMN